MAISPYRVSILRGVNAMARGVKNPYGKPQLSSAPVNKPKLASSQREVKPRLNKAENSQIGGNKLPSLSGTFKTSRVIQSKPSIKGVGQDNSAKTASIQNTSVGKKTYGQSGRTAPNIGPTSASGSIGYKQRSMRQAAAKAAVENLRQKRLKNG